VIFSAIACALVYALMLPALTKMLHREARAE